MRTSDPDVLKAVVRSTTAFVCVLVLASCTSGGSRTETANPCGISPSSEEEALVREVLGTEDFATKAYGDTGWLVDKMERALPVMRPEKHSFYTNACGYSVKDEQRDVRMTFLAGWFVRTSAVPSFPDDVSYSLNGARGTASGDRTTLLVQCDMPGELRAQSQNVWLTADTSFTSSPSRTVADQAAKDRRMTLTYLMARRVTEALGCENEPLAQPPVVKPLPAA
ncbi:hypothetical protein ACFWUZ_13135 [Streptomyces sp. NPDC058646]|uniref:hypothetical protein n=1 Tax=Streptomyces sp. NPDC058646 TaxID=3346574 RepID=UPI003668EE55